MYKVLIIEDDIDFFNWLAENLLREFPMSILLAHTLTEARACLAAEPFDLIFADILLGDSTSLDLTPYVRRHQPSTPLIIVSKFDRRDLFRSQGRFAQQLSSRIGEMGAAAHLVKPFTPEELVDTVRPLLRPCSPS